MSKPVRIKVLSTAPYMVDGERWNALRDTTVGNTYLGRFIQKGQVKQGKSHDIALHDGVTFVDDVGDAVFAYYGPDRLEVTDV